VAISGSPLAKRLAVLAAVVCLPAAAAAADVDTAKLGELRSLTAEAAAVATAHGRGRLTATYAKGQLEEIRREILKLLSDPALKTDAAAALAALDRRDAAALARCRDRLVAMERTRGRVA
jgi:opacity protein-like surface antigen